MAQRFAELAFTPAVRAAQQRYGAAGVAERLLGPADAQSRLGPDETRFLAERDSFYLATVGSDGWPYVQHRGGRPGLLKVLDEQTIGWADLRGNRQYVTVGNLDPAGPARVAMIVMDLASPSRIKVLGRARVVDAADDPDLVAGLAMDGYSGIVERAVLVTVEAFSWNCAKHIVPRYTAAEIATAIGPLQAEIAALRHEIRRLRHRRAQDQMA